MPRNNDKSVRIFSLTQSRLLETLEFPIAMNHASISPDGKLLLAVGDKHTAFFYKRVQLPNDLSGGASSYPRYEWHEIAGLKLSLSESEGACFSTAFSPSGRTYISKNPLKLYPQLGREIFRKPNVPLFPELAYDSDVLLESHADSDMRVDICAVASQNGFITIFDTALIHGDVDAEAAVMEVLRSSRPSTFTGAVRSMSFSPGPWDLLAW